MKSSPYSNLKIFAHAEEINRVRNGGRTAPFM